MTKRALITGITGQDGDLLARLLLSKGYEVHGIRRRASSRNLERIDDLISSPEFGKNLHLHYGDLTDGGNLNSLMAKIQPDEIYNLAAQSHVHVSFDQPEYTADVNALGTLRLLEAIRNSQLSKKTKFYQASTSELFGKIQEPVQSESTPFYPRSPYAVAKLFGHWITINYREAYNMHASTGILFNHESAKRGEGFVTRKITRALSRIYLGVQDSLSLGNLDASRDWGHAEDYVEMQWRILQKDTPDDYVIASGEARTVREFVLKAANALGVGVAFEGEGVEEVGIISHLSEPSIEELRGVSSNLKVGDTILRVDPWFFRPSEVEVLLGNAKKAYEKLNFQPKKSFDDMVIEMVRADTLEALLERQKNKFLVELSQ